MKMEVSEMRQSIIKFKNGSEIHSIDCDEGVRGQNAYNIWIDKEVLCHSCIVKDICKYHGDYLEQMVHIIDTYDRVFELNCNLYKGEY